MKFRFWKRPQPKSANRPLLFFVEHHLDRLNFRFVVKRVSNQGRGDLLFEPLLYRDVEWMIKHREREFKQLLLDEYRPGKPITYDMPKKLYAFRPVSYLNPIDSIVYQALVDHLVKHSHTRFSKQVYSNIINPITHSQVFNNPVKHWLDMRTNLRYHYSNGYNHYFFCDISGYFENIKIKTLLKSMSHYVGRNERDYLILLAKLLEEWQYAEAQGIIQPNNASSILSKIYLTRVDSRLSFLDKAYNRYVDEFHIMTKSEADLRQVAILLSQELRALGLNLNVAKSRFHKDTEIPVELDQDSDFFNSVNYSREVIKDFLNAELLLDEKFNEVLRDVNKDGEFDTRIFRFIIRKWQIDNNPRAIESCLTLFLNHVHVTVDVVFYLRAFIRNQEYESQITTRVLDFLKSQQNLHSWQQIWLLALLFEKSDLSDLDRHFFWNITHDRNQDDISVAVAYLILARILEGYDLVSLESAYHSSTSVLVKRAILFCATKFTTVYKESFFKSDPNDDLLIKISKTFLRESDFDLSNFSILGHNA